MVIIEIIKIINQGGATESKKMGSEAEATGMETAQNEETEMETDKAIRSAQTAEKEKTGEIGKTEEKGAIGEATAEAEGEEIITTIETSKTAAIAIKQHKLSHNK